MADCKKGKGQKKAVTTGEVARNRSGGEAERSSLMKSTSILSLKRTYAVRVLLN